jgi:hypothetical protein
MRYIAILQTLISLLSVAATHWAIDELMGLSFWSVLIHLLAAILYTFWVVIGSITRIYGLIVISRMRLGK